MLGIPILHKYPKVGMTQHCEHCSQLHVELAKMAASGSQRHRLTWVDCFRFTVGGRSKYRGGLAPRTCMKTVPAIGTTLGYLTCPLIDSVHVCQIFCAVDPYLRK